MSQTISVLHDPNGIRLKLNGADVGHGELRDFEFVVDLKTASLLKIGLGQALRAHGITTIR